MKCPACNNELKTITNRGIEVNYCENCKGVWFDLSEMHQLSNAVKEFNIVEPRLENLKLIETMEKTIKCPRCGAEMDKVMMNGELPIFDYCPYDCGYWFGENEVKEYIKNNMNAVQKPNEQAMVEILKKTK